MDINILFIIVVIVLCVGAVFGWKRGLLEGVLRIVSCALGILVVVIVAKGIGNFMQHSYTNVLMAVILLVAVNVIYKIIKFLIDTFKLVRSLAIGRIADRLAGAVLGLVEAVFVVWLMFFLIGSFDVLNLNAWILAQVSESRFLSTLYYSNYIVKILGEILL